MSTSKKIPSKIIGAQYYHTKGITGKNITIAILDSGLAPHPDIKPNRILSFVDYINTRKIPYDDYEHGTHVAGIIGSTKIGIAPDTNFISIKVLDHNGDGSIDNLINGIKWIITHYSKYHIKIVNISIGGNISIYDKNILNEWIKKLWYCGMVVCCSAGNNGPKPNTITAPGNVKEIITVGSSDGAHYSSAGPLSPYITKPEIVAPGFHILSTKPHNGYAIKNGTSMSVPIVTGSIALLLQLAPQMTNEDVKIHLMNCAKPISYLPYNMQGAGLLDLDCLLHDFI